MNDDKHTMPMAEFEKQFPNWREATAAFSIPTSADEVTKLKEALATCACSLDCMTGLPSRAENHRQIARQAIREALHA